MHPSGQFAYVANQVSDDVSAFRIGEDGSLSSIPGSPFKAGAESVCVAVEPTGKFLYVSSKFSHSVWAFRIGQDGALTPIEGSPYAAGREPNSVAFSLAPDTSDKTPAQ